MSCAFIACENESDTLNDKSNDSSTSSQSNHKAIHTCFEKFDYNFSQILSKEDVLKYIDASLHADVKVNENNKKNRYGTVSYTWKSDRTFTVKAGNVTQEIPDKNTIELSGLSFSNSDETRTLELFEKNYKKISDKEYQDLIANLEKSYADKSAAELEQAKKLLEVRKNLNYTEIPNLGSAAYWKEVQVTGNNFGIELYVLAGTVEFKISVKSSDNNNTNADIAHKLAQDILKKCS